MSAPLPNGFVMDAWKASVGASADSSVTQRRVTQLGTRSHLLRMKIRFFCFACFFR